ncbi:MAG: helix-turn-helix domain-containing protein [Phycisphaerales bacterium]|nr:MAG: helix-turn-helix domain-containing protein [Phycisphaerales bacterium]
MAQKDNVNELSLRQIVDELIDDPKMVGVALRMDVAAIVLKALKKKKLTQSQLAKAARMNDPEISAIVHGDSNLRLETIGRVFHALGIRVHIVETLEAEEDFTETAAAGSVFEMGSIDGKETEYGVWKKVQINSNEDFSSASGGGSPSTHYSLGVSRPKYSASDLGGQCAALFPSGRSGSHSVVLSKLPRRSSKLRSREIVYHC